MNALFYLTKYSLLSIPTKRNPRTEILSDHFPGGS